MGTYVAQQVIKLMIKKDIAVKNADILILGFTFKENCPDVRNTRVIDIVNTLHEYNTRCEIYDPWADPQEVFDEYRVSTIKNFDALKGNYDAIIIAVGHQEFFDLNYERLKKKTGAVLYDLKGILNSALVDERL